MSFAAIVEVINFFLANIAALVSFGILRKVAGNLALTWRYPFIAFQILSLATLFAVIDELGISSIIGVNVNLLKHLSHFAFVILAFFGLLRQYWLLKALTKRGA